MIDVCTRWVELAALVNRYLNFFQPVMALVEKKRNAAKVTKRYVKTFTRLLRSTAMGLHTPTFCRAGRRFCQARADGGPSTNGERTCGE